MALPNIFSSEVTLQLVGRINQLSETSRPKWGKMDAAQMLAHCNVTYEMCFENKHKKPGAVKAFLLKTFVKKLVTNETPYKHNSQTAPEFLIKSSKDFQTEKTRLINYLEKAVEIGIDEITPILTKRTERDQVKMARMEKIVLAAMKQTITPWMPKLNEAIGFSAFLKQQLPENRFIAHCEELDKRYLTNVSLGSEDLLVLVGPEGDFTMEEIEKCIDNGFQGISLGESRLRAETAAVVVCAQVQAAWQMKA